jgi:hypothetical protein
MFVEVLWNVCVDALEGSPLLPIGELSRRLGVRGTSCRT